MNKEISDSLHFLLHCSLKDVRFETQREQFEFIYKYIENLEKENQSLKKQLEYLISGEYLNQLRFERDMLESIVLNREISKEDKEFIDMTRRNTELLEQQKEFIYYLEKTIIDSKAGSGQQYYYQQVLDMYKEIIGG